MSDTVILHGQESIVGVAIRHECLIVSLPKPKRHADLIGKMLDAKMIVDVPPKENLGFLTSAGHWVPRTVAGGIAFKAGQTEKEYGRLTSDDLW